METPPPFPPQAAPSPKKGLPPLAWAGIGCGVFLILGVVAGALGVGWFMRTVDTIASQMSTDSRQEAAETAAGLLDGVELSGQDEAAGTVTFRVEGLPEETTLSREEFLRGEFPVPKPDGTTGPAASDSSAMPAWLPAYPSLLTVGGLFLSDGGPGAGTEGLFTFTTRDDPDTVAGFYASAFPWANSTSNSSVSVNQVKKLVRSYGDASRQVTIEVSGDGTAPSFVAVSFEE